MINLYKERVSIYAELDHYRATNNILGANKIFKERFLRQEIKALPLKELVKKYNATQKSIRLLKKQLDSKERPDLRESREENLVEKKWQLKVIEDVMQELDG